MQYQIHNLRGMVGTVPPMVTSMAISTYKQNEFNEYDCNSQTTSTMK